MRSWADGYTVEPTKGSVAYMEQQTAMDYGVPSFAVAGAGWGQNKGRNPAVSAGGGNFFRGTTPGKNRGGVATPEINPVL